VPFEAVPIVDHHAHSLLRRPPADRDAFRAGFTESADPRVVREHLGTSLFYRRAVRDLAAFFGVEGEAALVAHCAARPLAERARALFADARFELLLIDVGYRPDDYLSLEELSAFVPVRRVLRLEREAEALVADAADADDLLARLLARVREARAAGCVGLKTILAYRTGLAVADHGAAAVARAFAAAREAARRAGRVRLASKPLLDTLVREACREAARLALPVQVHCGFGDADLLLPEADPTRLKPLLEDPGCRDLEWVLLHCHPFVEEAAWLASVYGNVSIDLSLTIPMLGHGAADAVRAALAHAPFSKVLLATDAFSTPELYWVGARAMREALGRALEGIRADGYLAAGEAEEVAGALLGGNARRVYRLE
jgi:hypothetical protein